MEIEPNVTPDFSNIPIPDLSDIPWYKQEKSIKFLSDFLLAIEWHKETSLHTLVGFHFFLWLVTIWIWRHRTLKFYFWLILCGLAFGSEKLNEICSKHHEQLGFSEQYFDSQGYFILAVWAAPILLLIVVLTCKMLSELCNDMVDIKVQQLKHQKKVKKNE